MPARSLLWFLAVGAALSPFADAKATADAKPPQPRTDLNGDPLPAGAVARLGSARLCQQAVHFLAFSPDDKAVAALDSGCLRLWDVRTGRELRHFDDPFVGEYLAAPNVPLAFSPDGKLVALICGRNTVRIWDAANGREVNKIENLPGAPSDLVFNPKGRLLAVGSNGGPIHLWDFTTWTRLSSGETVSRMNWLTFSSDGKEVIAAVVQTTPAKEEEKIFHLSINSSGTANVRACLSEGQPVAAPAPDGALFAAPAKDGTTLLLGTTFDGKEVRRTEGKSDRLSGARFSGDGRFVTAASGDGILRVWGVADGKIVHEFKALPGGVERVALSHDGRLLAAAGSADDAIHIWDLDKAKELHSFAGHRSGPLSVVFSKDGKSVFTTNRDGLYKGVSDSHAEWSLREWDPTTGKERRVIKGDLKGPIAYADFSRDGRILTLVTTDGTLHFWDVAAGKEVHRRALPIAVLGRQFTGGRIKEVVGVDIHEPQFSPDGRVLYAGGARDATIHRWDTTTGDELPSLRTPNDLFPSIPQASPDGKSLLVTETGQGGLHMTLVDAQTGQVIRSLWEGRGGRVAWDLSPDGRTLAASDGSGTVLVEVAGGRDRGGLGDGAGVVMNLIFSPDGKVLAVVGDNEVRLWRVATGELIARLKGCGGQADCLAFSPDGKRLAVSENCNTVLIFDVDALSASAPAPQPLTDQETADLWADLSDADAAKAYWALGRLAADPVPTVAFVKAHWKPAPELDARRVNRLLADLDDDDFDVREKATDELRRHSPATDEAMRRSLRDTPSPEVRYRIRQALKSVPSAAPPPPSAELVDLRVVELLELCGTGAAERLLKNLERGPAGSQRTREAHAALGRMAGRAGSPP